MRPSTIQEIQELIRESPRVLPQCGFTKPALSSPPEGFTSLDLSGLAGMKEYEPNEYTFTALAGTRILDLVPLLEEYNQYLPFDPLLVEQGATLGGTVGSGLSGPGRYRYGGVRDFLMGIRFVDSSGEAVRSGGKVVKNSAGFDLPKFMVGSLGRFGVLAELSFKVFPKPEKFATLKLDFENIDLAMQALYKATASQLDLYSLELVSAPAGYTFWVRIGGLTEAISKREERVRGLFGDGELFSDQAEEKVWRDWRELTWVPDGWWLVKIPITPAYIPQIESELAGQPILRRYSYGGQAAWLAMEAPPDQIQTLLDRHQLAGLVVLGDISQPWIGTRSKDTFLKRVKSALDPIGRFPEV